MPSLILLQEMDARMRGTKVNRRDNVLGKSGVHYHFHSTVTNINISKEEWQNSKSLIMCSVSIHSRREYVGNDWPQYSNLKQLATTL